MNYELFSIHFENNPSESTGGLKGQYALSPGQRPGFPIGPHYSAPTGQKPYNVTLQRIYFNSSANLLIKSCSSGFAIPTH